MQAHHRRRRRTGAPDHTGTARGRELGQHQPPVARRGLHAAALCRHPLQRQRGRRGRMPYREGAHQPGQLRRSGPYLQAPGIYGRAIRTGTGKDRGTTDDVYRPLQGAPYGGTHWREPRKPLRSHHVALRRHARRYRGELHGVSSHLPQAQLRRRGHLHQGVQHGCHGAVSTPAGSGDGSRGHALPTPSRCNRGG